MSIDPGRPRLIQRQMSEPRPRAIPSAAGLARRRFIVTGTKWVLPGAAVVLLLSIALWPELSRLQQREQTVARALLQTNSSRMRAPHFRGVDERGRPYTVTADSALQAAPQRIELETPKADLVAGSDWLFVTALDGVYVQHAGQLDLSRHVWLYRSDGMILRTESAAVDMKAGAAAGNQMTHIEGPFGTIDAQGFALLDKGAVIQFTGPARLIVNQSK